MRVLETKQNWQVIEIALLVLLNTPSFPLVLKQNLHY